MSDPTHTNAPFTQLISDFKGKKLPPEQIEYDYNNTLNYPNNYFVAPKSWSEYYYTTSRRNMLLLSRGIENIVWVKPPWLMCHKQSSYYIWERYITLGGGIACKGTSE